MFLIQIILFTFFALNSVCGPQYYKLLTLAQLTGGQSVTTSELVFPEFFRTGTARCDFNNCDQDTNFPQSVRISSIFGYLFLPNLQRTNTRTRKRRVLCRKSGRECVVSDDLVHFLVKLDDFDGASKTHSVAVPSKMMIEDLRRLLEYRFPFLCCVDYYLVAFSHVLTDDDCVDASFHGMTVEVRMRMRGGMMTRGKASKKAEKTKSSSVSSLSSSDYSSLSVSDDDNTPSSNSAPPPFVVSIPPITPVTPSTTHAISTTSHPVSSPPSFDTSTNSAPSSAALDDQRITALTELVNQMLLNQTKNERKIEKLLGVIEEKNEKLREVERKNRESKKKSEKDRKESEKDAKEESASTVFSPFHSRSPPNSPSKSERGGASEKERVEERDEREKKSAKPLKLTGIPIYDGKSSFKRWLKKFELKVSAGNHSDAVKYVTLLEYLSPSINDFLAELDRDTFSSYSLLINLLRQEHKQHDPIGGTTSVQSLLSIRQEPGECVSSFAARLAAAVTDCAEMDLHGTEFEKNCFIDGLRSNIQVKVREFGKSEDVQSLLVRAKEVEDNIAFTEAALSRHNRANTPHSPPHSPSPSPSHTPSLCHECKVNPTSTNHKYCSACFLKKKEKKRDKMSGSSGKKVKTVCSRCNVNPPNPGYGWCEQCYQDSRKSMPSPPPSRPPHTSPPSSLPPSNQSTDWTKYKVEFLPADDNATDPLLWSNAKVQSQKRCFYCAEPLKGHATPACKEKYPHYHYLEVRALKSRHIEPPGRSSQPTGPRMKL